MSIAGDTWRLQNISIDINILFEIASHQHFGTTKSQLAHPLDRRNDLTVEQHSRESIRIARIARELLKKFAAAFRLFQDMNEEGESCEMDKLKCEM